MATAQAQPSILVPWHRGQREFISSFARTTVVTAGQGGGKTTGGYWYLYIRMRRFPGESWLVGFPDYGLLQRVIINQPDPDRQTIIQFLESVGEAPHLYIQEKRIGCRSGQIFFASGEDLVGWEGAHVKGAWLDEFDLMPLAAYRRAMERTRMRQGWVLLTGTPRLIKWVGQELQPLWERGDPSVRRVQFPSTANPRYSRAAMEEAERTLPLWMYKRLHLGELAAEEGGNVFRREWWRYYETPPIGERTIQTADTAYKTKTTNDYSVVATWAEAKKGYYLLDLWRAKVEYPELQRETQMLYEKWKPSGLYVEDAASGQSLIQDLRSSTTVPIIPVKVDKDKMTRAFAVTGLVESGRVFLPQSAPWLHDFVEEHAEFPNGAHDDQVDTTVMALGQFSRRGVELYV